PVAPRPRTAADGRRHAAWFAQPLALLAGAGGGVAAGRPRVRRARPVRVVAERPARRSLTRALEPESAILTVVRRPDQRRDLEALLQCAETAPRLVVERTFEMAGHDRRQTWLHVRDL